MDGMSFADVFIVAKSAGRTFVKSGLKFRSFGIEQKDMFRDRREPATVVAKQRHGQQFEFLLVQEPGLQGTAAQFKEIRGIVLADQ